VDIIKARYAITESCAFQIVKQDDAWVVLIGLEFNNDEMTWLPMVMWFYTEDAALKWIQSLGPLFGNEDEDIKVINGDQVTTRKRCERPEWRPYFSYGRVNRTFNTCST